MSDIYHNPVPAHPNPSPVTLLLEATREYVDARFAHLQRDLGNAGVLGAVSGMPDFLRMAEESFDALYATRIPVDSGQTVTRITHGEVVLTRPNPSGPGWIDTIIGANDLTHRLTITEELYTSDLDHNRTASSAPLTQDQDYLLANRLIRAVSQAAAALRSRLQ